MNWNPITIRPKHGQKCLVYFHHDYQGWETFEDTELFIATYHEGHYYGQQNQCDCKEGNNCIHYELWTVHFYDYKDENINYKYASHWMPLPEMPKE